jgi:hypothetical protein
MLMPRVTAVPGVPVVGGMPHVFRMHAVPTTCRGGFLFRYRCLGLTVPGEATAGGMPELFRMAAVSATRLPRFFRPNAAVHKVTPDAGAS